MNARMGDGAVARGGRSTNMRRCSPPATRRADEADGLLSLAIENYRRVGMGFWARDAEALQRAPSADRGQVESG